MRGQPPEQSESDQRFVDFTRLSRDCVWETDSSLCLTFASRRAIDVIGHHSEQLLGRPLTDFGNFVDAHGNPRHVSMNGNFRDACFLATDDTGNQRLLSLSAIALFDPQTGAFRGIRGISRPLDIPTGFNSE